MIEFSGKTAVITGAASGIGFSLAQAAAGHGMNLALADIEDEALATAGAALEAQGATVLTLPTDVRDGKALEALRDAALQRFGAIHLVCNNAGIGGGGRVWEAPEEMWRWVLDVDLWSVIHGARVFVPALIEQGEGHVVNTASMAGLACAPGMGPYNVAKYGVVALTETLVQELAGTGVGASVLCPAFVKTRIHESARHAPDAVLALRDSVPAEQLSAGMAMMKALVDSGIDPDEVARQVFAAVEADRVYILTHPESLDWVKVRLQRIIDEGHVA